MKNTKLGSVQIYYSAYNEAAGLEKKVSAITSPDRTGAKVWYQSGPWRRRSPSAANVHASH